MKKVIILVLISLFLSVSSSFAIPLTGTFNLEDGIMAVLDPDNDGAEIGDEAAGRDNSPLSDPYNEYYWRFDGLTRTANISGAFVNHGDGTASRTREILRTDGTFTIHGDSIWGQQPGTVYEVSIQSHAQGVIEYSWDGNSWVWQSFEGSVHFWGEFDNEPFLFDLVGDVCLDYYGYNSVVNHNIYFGEITNASMSISPVPEPATIFLLGTSLLGLAGLGRKIKS